MTRIPLSLVTGFLGSGKTTFLQQTARRLAGRRVVYLVNEFSALDVDGAVLGKFGPNVVSIPGGSIFCKCLVSDFILNLSEIPRRFGQKPPPASSAALGAAGGLYADASGPGPEMGATPSSRSKDLPMPVDVPREVGVPAGSDAIEGVIIEASGIANPKVVADMLRETKLDAVYDLASIVSVADPGSFQKLLATLPNIRAQIEAADIVLLNKIDLFREEQVEATAAAIRQIHPDVRIIRTVRAAVEIDLFGNSPPRDLHGEYAECADPHYGRHSVALHNALDLAQLQAALRDLGDVLYRAKGFIPTSQGTVYLDWSMAGRSVEVCRKGGAQAGLAMIARADRREMIEALVSRIQAGAFDVRS